MTILLIILTFSNSILLLFFIKAINWMNKLKEWEWFWSKQDILNRRNEVLDKLEKLISKSK